MSGSVTAGLAAALVILAGCRPDPGDPTAASSSSDGQQETHEAPSIAVRGVALSPRSHEAEDFSAFLDLATAAGDVLTHVGDWRQLQQPSDGFEAVVRLGRERGLIPLTVVSASSAGALIRPLDDTEIEEFLATLEAFVAEHRPDYLAALNRYTDLPVIITETGWPTDRDLALNPGSEAAQAAYVDRLATLVEAADVVMVVWPFVYDTLIDEEPFGSYGLRRPDGSARPAWRRWVKSAR